MRDGPGISSIGALMGDPARVNMLTSLMSVQALTSGELAQEAGVAATTASGHLAQLLGAGLLAVEKRGRHRYYRLGGVEVAAAIEALMGLAGHSGLDRVRPGPKQPEMRLARVCYDHLAGERGVALFVRLTARKLIALEDGAIVMTAAGERHFQEFGIGIDALKAAKRTVCRTCLDWSERREHLAGGLGASLLDRFFTLDWVHRIEGTRALRFTARGDAAFAEWLA